MEQFLYFIAAFIGSTISAIVIMPWLLNLCHKHKLTQEMNGAQSFRIPRIGGMVLAPAATIGLSLNLGLRLYSEDISETLKSSSFFIALGLMLIYLAGLVDDIFGLNKWLKRFVLIVSSIAFPLCGLYINELYGLFGINQLTNINGFILTAFITILTVKGIENMNDSDGLAATICLVPLLTFSAVFFYNGYYSYSTIAISMSGALLVYLYYNLFGDERIGTKTYMGHAGSLIMSYSIVYLSLKYAMDNSRVIDSHADGLIVPLTMLIIPIFDYIRVWITSNWNGLSKEDRKQRHIQHILIGKGFTQWQVMLLVLTADIAFIAVNLSLYHLANTGITLILLIDIIVYTVALYSVERGKPLQVNEQYEPMDFPGYKGDEGLVSVIMATWNSSRYVAKSIDSIISQTYTNWELIITDDCSTDDTMKILREYAAKDSRIKILQNEKNGGAGVSRNKSIMAAKGQYIAFCDSDDRWISEKLEMQIEFMKSKDVALCFAPYYSCDGGDQYLGYISAPRRVTLFQMMCDNKIGFLTAIYDTHKLGKHLMPKQRKRQDHAMLLNLLKTCRFAYSVQQPLAHYRIHSGNISGNKISLLKYNAQTYTEVFGWSKPVSYAFLFTFFIPTYLRKRIKNLMLTVARAAVS